MSANKPNTVAPSDLEAQLATANSEIDSYQKQVSDLLKEKAELTDKLEEASIEKADNVGHEAKIVELETIIEEKEAKIVELEKAATKPTKNLVQSTSATISVASNEPQKSTLVKIVVEYPEGFEGQKTCPEGEREVSPETAEIYVSKGIAKIIE